MATKPAPATTRVQSNTDTGIPGFGNVPPAPADSPAATGQADGQPKRGKKSEKTPEQISARKAENRARFIKLAPKRVNATLRRLKHIKALANKSGYEYTMDEAKKICDAIFAASAEVGKAFAGQKESTNEFTL